MVQLDDVETDFDQSRYLLWKARMEISVPHNVTESSDFSESEYESIDDVMSNSDGVFRDLPSVDNGPSVQLNYSKLRAMPIKKPIKESHVKIQAQLQLQRSRNMQCIWRRQLRNNSCL